MLEEIWSHSITQHHIHTSTSKYCIHLLLFNNPDFSYIIKLQKLIKKIANYVN